MMKADLAGAPVSYGVFELTPAGAETVSADQLLDSLAQAGYSGVDLGPLGFLGEGAVLRERLESRGLSLAGGWVQLPFCDDEAFEAALPGLERVLAVFAAAAEALPARLPLPTLADDGSVLRREAPGRGAVVDPVSAERWGLLIRNASRAAERVRAAGFEPTFHHHAGTYVESPDEIDRFLAETGIGLTLDTGHLFIAGGDPLEAVERWGGQINHLHLKDVDLVELRRVLGAGGGMREVWQSGAFVAFGRGDIDLPGVMERLDARGYEGWVVVEQDVLNGPDVSIERFLAERSEDQRVNRAALSRWL